MHKKKPAKVNPAFAPPQPVAPGGEGHAWDEDEVEAFLQGLGAAGVVVGRLLDLPGRLRQREEVLVVGEPEHVHPGRGGGRPPAPNKVSEGGKQEKHSSCLFM